MPAMSVEAIDKKIEELQLQRAQAIETEMKAKAKADFEEAREILGRLVTDVSRLNELGYVPPRIEQALTDGKGKFNPGLYIKRPKVPASLG